jgi:predicted Zn-dependent protease
MQFEADYYDGISPRAKRVLVSIQESAFLFDVPVTHTDTQSETTQTTTKTIKHLISTADVQARLGGSKRLIDFADGSRLETDYLALEKCLPATKKSRFWQAVHYAETHKTLVLIAFIGIIVSSMAMLRYGVPIIAKYAAAATPVSVENELGKHTLDTLDRKELGYFEASQIPQKQQLSIRNALANFCTKSANCPQYNLNFRKSESIGANAFALPGGAVVITDELIKLAKNNDEIIAVLAHELGHVKQRHALRQTLQGTLSGLLIVAITGDVSSVAAGLPAIMINMRYTRDLETEADDYALASMKKACIPTKYFATLLLRLESSHGGAGAMPEMLSSHPETRKRIVPFLKNHANCT